MIKNTAKCSLKVLCISKFERQIPGFVDYMSMGRIVGQISGLP